VRALTRRPDQAALPADGVEAVFLVWTAAAGRRRGGRRTFYQWAADNAAAFADPGLAPDARAG